MKIASKNTLWKIYFFGFILSLILVAIDSWPDTYQIFIYPRTFPRAFISGFIIIPLTILAVYSYSFRKRVLSQKYWTIFFWLKLVSFILFTYSDLSSSDPTLKLSSLGFISVLVFDDFIPLYILYKLSCKMKTTTT